MGRKPAPKITKPCACGCGQLVTGTPRRKYYSRSCETRVHRAAKKAKEGTK